MFKTGDIVKEDSGIKSIILYYDSSETWFAYTVNWFKAQIIEIPESVQCSHNVGDIYSVNSSFVSLA